MLQRFFPSHPRLVVVSSACISLFLLLSIKVIVKAKFKTGFGAKRNLYALIFGLGHLCVIFEKKMPQSDNAWIILETRELHTQQ